MRGRVNTSSGNDFANDNSSGSFIISRGVDDDGVVTHDSNTADCFDATKVTGYRNGFRLGNVATKTAEAVPSAVLEVLNVTGNDGSGQIAFMHSGDRLFESQARSLAYMFQEYVNEVEGNYDEGVGVTTSMLDASVNITNNTTYMQDFLDAAVGSTLGKLGDETYLVNDQLNIPDSPNIQGVIGKSTIRADASSMNNELCLVLQGRQDKLSFGGRIDGLIVDYNIERTSTSGGLNEDSDGNAFALHNVHGGRYTNITCMSARKHCFDILGNTYNRSGSNFTFNKRHNLTSRNIYVDHIKCMGMGDDGFTTHGVEYITAGYVHGEFSRGTYSNKNSNAVEIDDISRFVSVKNASGRFVNKGVEVKGHGDTEAAEHVYFGRIVAEHCARGFEIRHISHGSNFTSSSDNPVSPSNGDVIIDNFHFRCPLAYHGAVASQGGTDYLDGFGILDLDPQASFVYAYDRVQIGNYTARCDGAPNVIKTQVMQVGGGGTNYFVGRTDIFGFTQSTVGIDVYAGYQLNQYTMFGSVRIQDSGITYGIDIDTAGDVDGIISSYAIRTSNTNTGSAGIRGNSDVKLGTGFVIGYTNHTTGIGVTGS